MSQPDLDAYCQAAVDALTRHVRESAEIDKAWRRGTLSEWVAHNLEAERKAFYGDSGNGDDGGTDPQAER